MRLVAFSSLAELCDGGVRVSGIARDCRWLCRQPQSGLEARTITAQRMPKKIPVDLEATTILTEEQLLICRKAEYWESP